MVGESAKTESACAIVPNLSHGAFWKAEKWLRGLATTIICNSGDWSREHRDRKSPKGNCVSRSAQLNSTSTVIPSHLAALARRPISSSMPALHRKSVLGDPPRPCQCRQSRSRAWRRTPYSSG